MSSETKPAITQTLAPAPYSTNSLIYLFKKIWPDAPEPEMVRAAIVCKQYGLNPLMKTVFLIPFKQKDGSSKWEVVMGIKASRIIAQRQHKYSYIDGPRVMTKKEQEDYLGFADPVNIRAIVKIKDEKGNVFPGYGLWPGDIKVYGNDKGNSPLNMAFIRAERNALDKLAPGEMPNNIEVADENYTDFDMQATIKEGENEFHEVVQNDIDELWPGKKPEIDMVWVKEAIERIRQDKPAAWNRLSTMLRNMSNGRRFDTWSGYITNLERADAEKFVAALQNALEG